MAKSHPARPYVHAAPRASNRARSTVAGFLLVACLAALSIAVHDRYLGRFVLQATAYMIEPLEETTDSPIAVEDAKLQEAEVAAPAADPNADKYRAIAEYVARRYRVSEEQTANIVAIAYAAGQGLKLDPLLILAVISVESRFNPIAESVMGAKGLMQVMPQFHRDKLKEVGGEKAVFDPLANIMVGAKILKNYLAQTGGDLTQALHRYVGGSIEEDYAGKVLVERDRLQEFLRSWGMKTTQQSRKATTAAN